MQGCIGRPDIISGRQTFDVLDTVEHRHNEVLWKMHGKIFYLERHAIKFCCLNSGAPNGNFRENISSEDDLRSRIFGAFVVKFLA